MRARVEDEQRDDDPDRHERHAQRRGDHAGGNHPLGDRRRRRATRPHHRRCASAARSAPTLGHAPRHRLERLTQRHVGAIRRSRPVPRRRTGPAPLRDPALSPQHLLQRLSSRAKPCPLSATAPWKSGGPVSRPTVHPTRSPRLPVSPAPAGPQPALRSSYASAWRARWRKVFTVPSGTPMTSAISA